MWSKDSIDFLAEPLEPRRFRVVGYHRDDFIVAIAPAPEI
jgi:hypothetical protein